ncbi:MAG: HIRAN domain-containing protein [Solobacterium sp.]|nr:HIRAN domain-containing protein [Solobacterium sp.]
MSELIKKPENLVSLFHSTSEKLPKPFETEIFLYRTFISGPWVAGREEIAEHLEEQEVLKLVREPENMTDELAVKVYTREGVKLGYIAWIDNQVCARLMDAGKNVYARIFALDITDYDAMITVDIYMRD